MQNAVASRRLIETLIQTKLVEHMIRIDENRINCWISWRFFTGGNGSTNSWGCKIEAYRGLTERTFYGQGWSTKQSRCDWALKKKSLNDLNLELNIVIWRERKNMYLPTNVWFLQVSLAPSPSWIVSEYCHLLKSSNVRQMVIQDAKMPRFFWDIEFLLISANFTTFCISSFSNKSQ